MESLPDDNFVFPEIIPLNEHHDDDPPGLTCELKTYEARYNAAGERIYMSVGSKRELNIPRARDHDSAMVLTRFYDKERELEKTNLCIQSPHLKTALRSVIKKYPSLSLEGHEIVISDLPKCLFHYRNELRDYSFNVRDRKATEHVDFALRYMEQVLRDQLWNWFISVDVKGSEAFRDAENESPILEPGLSFADLWMAFRPGCLVYARETQGGVILRLVEVIDYLHRKFIKPRWRVETVQIVFDGESFGYDSKKFNIFPYEGHCPFRELEVFPLEYHPEKDKVLQEFISRGRKYVSLRGVHCQEYDGVGKALSPFRDQSYIGEHDYFPLQSMLVKGRVMIDAHTFGMRNPGNMIEVDSLEPEKESDKDGDLPKFTDDDYAICSDEVLGFSFSNKQWCHFKVSLLKDVDFNLEAFNSLILPETQKKMIHSLVKVHSDERLKFDDMIKGKGKGMIFLLHGVPGVGKTLTAESIADHIRSPLYTISSGELGTNGKELEQKLSIVLQLAATWKAIILIDEADVFLEQRNVQDLERNGLVSIFLRLLEYYEGILFLTTNRVEIFDKAFKSRVHHTIKYHPLSRSARSQLWEHFIRSTYPDSSLEWLDTECLGRLAEAKLNGREIKNTFRTSHALAIFSEKPFSEEHIKMALQDLSTSAMGFEDDSDSSNAAELSTTRAPKRRRLD